MKKFISSPERKKLTLSIMMKLKSLRVSIPNKIEYLLDRVKKLPSFIFSMTRSIGGDLKDLAKHIRQEGIPIKRLSRFLISLPSRLFEDLKSTKRISSYISISVVGAIGLVLLIIVTLDCVGAMIDGAGDVTAEYNFLQVLIYVALTVPGRIYEFLPTASLIGCLVGLGALANNSELIVIRAAGLSVMRIVWIVLRPILFLVLIGVLFGEYVVTHTEKYAESRRMLLTKDKVAQGSASGLWNKEGNEFTHIAAIFPGGELFGVTRYEFDENHVLKKASFSDKASFQNGTWVEEFGAATYFEANNTRVETFIQRIWTTELSPELLNIASLPSESLSMRDLSKHSSYLNDQGQNASRYELDFWRKALQPLTFIGLILIASSFIFGPLRRVSMGYRVFAGVVVGIVFRISQDLLGPASIVFGFSPFIAVIFPAIICSLIGIFLLKKSS